MTDHDKHSLPPGQRGGLAAWSVYHPVGVVMITLAVVVIGAFSLGRLEVDLLPHIIYPEVRVRILDPGVPAQIMEDQVTRQLEEQLAITEDAIAVQSRTAEGNASVDLSFQYGKDIDVALRDASTRLDRAKRFLPDTIDPPIIYKRDPSQIPVLEFVVSSALRDPVELRSWVDYTFAKWFLNLPGVAAAEVGGGLIREIQILPDQQRLAGLGLTLTDLENALQEGNVETPAGRLQMPARELSGRTAARFQRVEDIAALPLSLSAGGTVRLGEVAQVLDTHEDERLRVRMNGIPGIKVSIQKQPTANTVAVSDAAHNRLQWLKKQDLIPEDIIVHQIGDQAPYVRNALHNAAMAAGSGALLAMGVVYLFLGNLRRTLIIGSAIPIAVMVTFILMALGGLTLNIMTLGGLAVGVGMLVDNTIVMLENIYRHQRIGEAWDQAGVAAAGEVNSAIVASTSTNLAAVLPFLFIGGLIGLLFRELIFTVSAAIFASMVVALTLVPALAARVRTGGPGRLRGTLDAGMVWLQARYATLVRHALRHPLVVMVFFLATLVPAVWLITSGKQIFLPNLDDGRIQISITADPGITLEEMDHSVKTIEALIQGQPEVESVFTIAGGFIFGRTEREVSNQSSLTVQLKPLAERAISSEQWIQRLNKAIRDAQLAGIKVRPRTGGIRGIRTQQGDDDISLRIQGSDQDTLNVIGEEIAARLKKIPALRNIEHSAEEVRQELAIQIDRDRAAALGLSAEDVGHALRIALEGSIITDFIDGDRSYDVRLRLPPGQLTAPEDLEALLLYASRQDRPPVYLGDVASVALIPSPAEILRDNQQRIVEVTASLRGDAALGEVNREVWKQVNEIPLPSGYVIYDAGAAKELKKGQRTSRLLLGLALFLVFVVMAVQYESLRNPLVILFGVPFSLTGVAAGIALTGLPLSMPAWLGLIMLAGIVVNNAIVLVEYIEIVRQHQGELIEAIVEAARLRLRPILMTTLTTVVGLVPLSLGLGEGAEMLQPLAVVIVAGLSFSTLVSLILIPVLYRLLGRRRAT